MTNILAHIAASREQMVKRGEKNKVTVALGGLVMQHPDPGFATIGQVPTITTLVNGFKETLPDPNYKHKVNVVSMRLKGKDIAVVFNDRNVGAVRLAASLREQPPVRGGRAAKPGRCYLSKNTNRQRKIFYLR
ncbi:MAG: hypothetical protein ABL933_17265 [Methyloglobulus sp.]|nr:hypothetical protein [Methyloglobulus sp.]